LTFCPFGILARSFVFCIVLCRSLFDLLPLWYLCSIFCFLYSAL
jgi:hypothetical protein